jgi:hypothetical protein
MRRRDTQWQHAELSSNRPHYEAVREQLKAAMRSGVRELFGHPIDTPNDMFDAIDRDGGGTITLQELIRGMKRLDVGLSDVQIERLLGVVDRNHDKVVDRPEFLALFRLLLGPSPDVDGGGGGDFDGGGYGGRVPGAFVTPKQAQRMASGQRGHQHQQQQQQQQQRQNPYTVGGDPRRHLNGGGVGVGIGGAYRGQFHGPDGEFHAAFHHEYAASDPRHRQFGTGPQSYRSLSPPPHVSPEFSGHDGGMGGNSMSSPGRNDAFQRLNQVLRTEIDELRAELRRGQSLWDHQLEEAEEARERGGRVAAHALWRLCHTRARDLRRAAFRRLAGFTDAARHAKAVMQVAAAWGRARCAAALRCWEWEAGRRQRRFDSLVLATGGGPAIRRHALRRGWSRLLRGDQAQHLQRLDASHTEKLGQHRQQRTIATRAAALRGLSVTVGRMNKHRAFVTFRRASANHWKRTVGRQSVLARAARRAGLSASRRALSRWRRTAASLGLAVEVQRVGNLGASLRRSAGRVVWRCLVSRIEALKETTLVRWKSACVAQKSRELTLVVWLNALRRRLEGSAIRRWKAAVNNLVRYERARRSLALVAALSKERAVRNAVHAWRRATERILDAAVAQAREGALCEERDEARGSMEATVWAQQIQSLRHVLSAQRSRQCHAAWRALAQAQRCRSLVLRGLRQLARAVGRRWHRDGIRCLRDHVSAARAVESEDREQQLRASVEDCEQYVRSAANEQQHRASAEDRAQKLHATMQRAAAHAMVGLRRRAQSRAVCRACVRWREATAYRLRQRRVLGLLMVLSSKRQAATALREWRGWCAAAKDQDACKKWVRRVMVMSMRASLWRAFKALQHRGIASAASKEATRGHAANVIRQFYRRQDLACCRGAIRSWAAAAVRLRVVEGAIGRLCGRKRRRKLVEGVRAWTTAVVHARRCDEKARDEQRRCDEHERDEQRQCDEQARDEQRRCDEQIRDEQRLCDEREKRVVEGTKCLVRILRWKRYRSLVLGVRVWTKAVRQTRDEQRLGDERGKRLVDGTKCLVRILRWKRRRSLVEGVRALVHARAKAVLRARRCDEKAREEQMRCDEQIRDEQRLCDEREKRVVDGTKCLVRILRWTRRQKLVEGVRAWTKAVVHARRCDEKTRDEQKLCDEREKRLAEGTKCLVRLVQRRGKHMRRLAWVAWCSCKQLEELRAMNDQVYLAAQHQALKTCLTIVNGKDVRWGMQRMKRVWRHTAAREQGQKAFVRILLCAGGWARKNDMSSAFRLWVDSCRLSVEVEREERLSGSCRAAAGGLVIHTIARNFDLRRRRYFLQWTHATRKASQVWAAVQRCGRIARLLSQRTYLARWLQRCASLQRQVQAAQLLSSAVRGQLRRSQQQRLGTWHLWMVAARCEGVLGSQAEENSALIADQKNEWVASLKDQKREWSALAEEQEQGREALVAANREALLRRWFYSFGRRVVWAGIDRWRRCSGLVGKQRQQFRGVVVACAHRQMRRVFVDWRCHSSDCLIQRTSQVAQRMGAAMLVRLLDGRLDAGRSRALGLWQRYVSEVQRRTMRRTAYRAGIRKLDLLVDRRRVPRETAFLRWRVTTARHRIVTLLFAGPRRRALRAGMKRWHSLAQIDTLRRRTLLRVAKSRARGQCKNGWVLWVRARDMHRRRSVGARRMFVTLQARNVRRRHLAFRSWQNAIDVENRAEIASAQLHDAMGMYQDAEERVEATALEHRTTRVGHLVCKQWTRQARDALSRWIADVRAGQVNAASHRVRAAALRALSVGASRRLKAHSWARWMGILHTRTLRKFAGHTLVSFIASSQRRAMRVVLRRLDSHVQRMRRRQFACSMLVRRMAFISQAEAERAQTLLVLAVSKWKGLVMQQTNSEIAAQGLRRLFRFQRERLARMAFASWASWAWADRGEKRVQSDAKVQSLRFLTRQRAAALRHVARGTAERLLRSAVASWKRAQDVGRRWDGLDARLLANARRRGLTRGFGLWVSHGSTVHFESDLEAAQITVAAMASQMRLGAAKLVWSWATRRGSRLMNVALSTWRTWCDAAGEEERACLRAQHSLVNCIRRGCLRSALQTWHREYEVGVERDEACEKLETTWRHMKERVCRRAVYTWHAAAQRSTQEEAVQLEWEDLERTREDVLEEETTVLIQQRTACLLGLLRGLRRRMLACGMRLWQRMSLEEALTQVEQARIDDLEGMSMSIKVFAGRNIARVVRRLCQRRAQWAERAAFREWREATAATRAQHEALGSCVTRRHLLEQRLRLEQWARAAAQVTGITAAARRCFVLLDKQLEHRARTALRRWSIVSSFLAHAGVVQARLHDVGERCEDALGQVKSLTESNHRLIMRNMVEIVARRTLEAALNRWHAHTYLSRSVEQAFCAVMTVVRRHVGRVAFAVWRRHASDAALAAAIQSGNDVARAALEERQRAAFAQLARVGRSVTRRRLARCIDVLRTWCLSQILFETDVERHRADAVTTDTRMAACLSIGSAVGRIEGRILRQRFLQWRGKAEHVSSELRRLEEGGRRLVHLAEQQNRRLCHTAVWQWRYSSLFAETSYDLSQLRAVLTASVSASREMSQTRSLRHLCLGVWKETLRLAFVRWEDVTKLRAAQTAALWRLSAIASYAVRRGLVQWRQATMYKHLDAVDQRATNQAFAADREKRLIAAAWVIRVADTGRRRRAQSDARRCLLWWHRRVAHDRAAASQLLALAQSTRRRVLFVAVRRWLLGAASVRFGAHAFAQSTATREYAARHLARCVRRIAGHEDARALRGALRQWQAETVWERNALRVMRLVLAAATRRLGRAALVCWANAASRQRRLEEGARRVLSLRRWHATRMCWFVLQRSMQRWGHYTSEMSHSLEMSMQWQDLSQDIEMLREEAEAVEEASLVSRQNTMLHRAETIRQTRVKRLAIHTWCSWVVADEAVEIGVHRLCMALQRHLLHRGFARWYHHLVVLALSSSERLREEEEECAMQGKREVAAAWILRIVPKVRQEDMVVVVPQHHGNSLLRRGD